MKTRHAMALFAALLSGCAEMLNWEAPPERTRVEGERATAPVQRPMQLVPESYRVAKGDTLFAIAFRNNLDYRDIAQWNGIGPDYRIVVGQVLRLSAPETSVLVERAVAPVPVASAPASTHVPAPAGVIPAAVPSPPAKPQPAPVTKPVPVPAPVAPSAPLKSAASDAASLPAEVAGSYNWQWPTDGRVLRGYAPDRGNKGIDFTGALGQPVFAAAPGRVVYSGNALKGYGELIIIKHDDVHLSAYGYNRKRHVKEGDVVTRGQPIGELGLGPESKPLLHFEIRVRGKPVNPSQFLPQRLSSD